MAESLRVLTMYNEDASTNSLKETQRLEEFLSSSERMPIVKFQKTVYLHEYLINLDACAKFVQEKSVTYDAYLRLSDSDIVEGKIVPSYVALIAPNAI